MWGNIWKKNAISEIQKITFRKRGRGRTRTAVRGFADPCLSHSATRPVYFLQKYQIYADIPKIAQKNFINTIIWWM